MNNNCAVVFHPLLFLGDNLCGSSHRVAGLMNAFRVKTCRLNPACSPAGLEGAQKKVETLLRHLFEYDECVFPSRRVLGRALKKQVIG